uniref:Uncharacterized protein n=1 Tax=Aegilops tauschii subsp. strangulata TaxID=200361 RepID=A0A452YQ74_AEGTS
MSLRGVLDVYSPFSVHPHCIRGFLHFTTHVCLTTSNIYQHFHLIGCVQVNYALGALYYLCNPSTKNEILKPDVHRIIRDYSAAGAVNSSFSNLANAFLDKHVNS